MEATGRLKVVHMTSVHGADDPRIVHKECATLAAAGHDVVIVAPGEARRLPDGVRHRAIPRSRGRLDRFVRTMPAVVAAALSERADVYHFHDPELLPAGLLLRLRGKAVVFDVHEDIVLDIETKPWIPRVLRAPVARVARFVLGILERHFTAIVAATHGIARTFTNPRTVVVMNYPRIEDFSPPQRDMPFEQRPLNAIYLGAITRVRGLDQMVDAIDEPGVPAYARLTLAGTFENEEQRQTASTRRGWRRTNAIGYVRRDELATTLAQARVGLLVLQPFASFEESLPTKLFEYMGAGLPVVASRFLKCGEVIERYRCGILVDPRNSAEIAAAMRTLFLHPRQAQRMGERGRAAVRARYQWTPEGKKLTDLYERLRWHSSRQ